MSAENAENSRGQEQRKIELLQSALSVIANSQLEIEDQIEEILKTGCKLFDEDIGIVSNIDGQQYVVEYVHTRSGGISRGQAFELGKTFCAITVQSDHPLGIEDVKKTEWRSHPCIETGLESYIGVQLIVDGKPFGTLNFSSPTPREKPFLEIDLDFCRTLGSWVSIALSRFRKFENLNTQATHDNLTGILNRAAFVKRVTACFSRGKMSADYSFAVLYIDLDGFKQINDDLGHSAGDEILKLVATKIEQTIRPKDAAARLGGDEFAVILEDVKSSMASEVAQRIHQAISKPCVIDSKDARVGASIGIAMNREFLSQKVLLGSADAAMYHAKKNGFAICVVEKNKYHCEA